MMKENSVAVSVVVPFYKGNQYIQELLDNVDQVACRMLEVCGADMEVIVINDSPDVPVEYTPPAHVPVRVIPNEKNIGIQGSRIHGIREAKGQWIQLLDQDDLLIAENYPQQFQMAENCDVVVGNCDYYYGTEKSRIYYNRGVMAYYIREERFLQIRNLIASPGHCLIRKDAFPDYWMTNPMRTNGADDYYLWILMFHQGAKFRLNEKPVYIHRNNNEGNLSFNLDKMDSSNMEMCRLLADGDYPARKLSALQRSIRFKYLYDTKKLKILDWIRYADKVWDNGVYKIITIWLKYTG